MIVGDEADAIEHRAPDVEIAADIFVEIDAEPLQPAVDLAEYLFRASANDARIAKCVKLAFLLVVEEIERQRPGRSMAMSR